MQKIKKKISKLQLLFAKKFRSKKYMKIYNNYLKQTGVHMNGDVKFIHPSVHLDTGYASNIHLGSNFVISINSIILAHDYSIECGMAAIGEGDNNNEKKFVRDVYIGDNVFIGAGCIILPGTKIGNNCIIGAGTVCGGVIPDNSVVIGTKCNVVANIKEWTESKKKYIYQ